MPGRPRLEKLERDIKELGGEEWIFDQIASGDSIGKIAEKLGVSRRMMYRWRDQRGHQEHRKALWAEAMRLNGEAQAEKGLDELDDLDPNTATSAGVQLVNAKSRYRQWLAGKRDPEQFGDKGLELSFNVGELHLRALQRPRSEVQEAEIIAVEDGDPITEVGGEAQAPERQLSPTSPSEEDEDELADLFD